MSAALLNVRELAELLRIHRITLYRVLKKSGIQGVKIGRQWRFRREDVNKLFEKGAGNGSDPQNSLSQAS